VFALGGRARAPRPATRRPGSRYGDLIGDDRPVEREEVRMAVLMREAIGGTLRRARTERRRTLRDVSRRARVSLGYLSEVERGRKEASSELLAAICEALDISLPDLLTEAADTIADAMAASMVPARRPIGLRHMDLRLAGATDPIAVAPTALPLGPGPRVRAAA
jgi:transcriptional regulator with XRE-family HTH domain